MSCSFRSYLTTNLDRLLELDARSANPPCRNGILAYPHNLDRQYIGDRAIYHLHGYIPECARPNDVEIVFSRSEYEQAYAPNSRLNRILFDTLENDPICFIGCSLDDPPLKKIVSICNQKRIERMIAMLRRGQPLVTPPRRYALLPKPVVSDDDGRFNHERSQRAVEEQQRSCADLDIQVVWYMPASSKDHTVLREAFEDLAGFPKMRQSIGWD